jgi:hypothetical protein
MNSFRYPCAIPPMKALPALLTASLLLAGTLLAEEAAPAPAKPQPSDAASAPAGDATAPAPAPAAAPGDKAAQLAPEPAIPTDGTAPGATPSLIPETQTTFVKPPPSPTWVLHHERASKTEQSETDLQARVRMRIALIKALPDPAVQAALQAANISPTDYERRKHLQHYYTLLYDRVAKIDNRFPLLLADTRKASVARVTQVKLEPSSRPPFIRTPLPPPLPAAPASASPTPATTPAPAPDAPPAPYGH